MTDVKGPTLYMACLLFVEERQEETVRRNDKCDVLGPVSMIYLHTVTFIIANCKLVDMLLRCQSGMENLKEFNVRSVLFYLCPFFRQKLTMLV